ncbi:hypothetical protein B0T11DRAFT_106150 [Plectosphaerella cucumerina]|uniref:Uncharacterized protein n=1 Tax=Plectosphaerella cucumerina TaxID=40658 RepID=A0A8K0T988_9PEZI|nr:hypothetical protein B0T11DRAFT_106150 [Plectosphaerella cucumerina]
MSRLQSGLVARRLSIFVIFQSLNWTTILPTPWLPLLAINRGPDTALCSPPSSLSPLHSPVHLSLVTRFKIIPTLSKECIWSKLRIDRMFLSTISVEPKCGCGWGHERCLAASLLLKSALPCTGLTALPLPGGTFHSSGTPQE